MTSFIRALADLATPMAIRVAATLSLVERAGTHGATAARLAADTGTSAPLLARLLDHLVTVGVFARDGDRYRPTELGEQLHEDDPSGIKRLFDINKAGGRAELGFVELLDTITTGTPGYVTRYGREFWADLDAQPELRRSFDAQMNWRFTVQAPQIARNVDWGRFVRIVDVGGGDATVLVEILKAHPEVRGQVVDLAPTAAAARDRIAAAGLADRAEVLARSFFEPLPEGADAYLLSDILHDWDDEHARDILTRCRAAAGPAGTVVVIESVPGRGVDTGMDLFMLMCFAGRERTVEELAALGAECGLRLRGHAPAAEGRTALEFGVTG